jgi:1,5-anhydro-D-fructose reductase (1,5-anhydro-D-mannitol-forming)
MIDACDEAGVKLGINFHSRFMPGFIDAKRIIDSGEIGAVQLVQIEASPGAKGGSRANTWRTDAGLAGLGTTMSIGVHVYDILRYLLSSEIETVSAFFDTPYNVMETTNLSMLRFGSGVIAQVGIHEITPYPHNDFVIYASKGRIIGRGLTRSRAGGEMHVTSSDAKTRVRQYPAVNAHEACVVDFSKAILEDRAPSASGLDGLKSVELTVAMAKSAWGGVHVAPGR